MWIVEIYTSKLVWEVQYEGKNGDEAMQILDDCIAEDWDTRMTHHKPVVLN